MVLNHVETSRRRQQPGDPVHPDHPAPQRCDGRGRGWSSPRGQQCSALVRRHVWHERTCSATLTSLPTQKARRRTSNPVLARPKFPPERAVVALAEHLRTQPTACGDTDAVRLTLPAAVQQAATHQAATSLMMRDVELRRRHMRDVGLRHRKSMNGRCLSIHSWNSSSLLFLNCELLSAL